jgi:hypothetical protein
VESLGGFRPSRSSAQGDNCSKTARPLICKREKIQLTVPSHSRPYGWPYFTAQESLATLVINLRWIFQLQWDLHHTLTMVPLPTFLGRQPPWLLTTSHIHSRKAEPLLLNAIIIIIPPYICKYFVKDKQEIWARVNLPANCKVVQLDLLKWPRTSGSGKHYHCPLRAMVKDSNNACFSGVCVCVCVPFIPLPPRSVLFLS